MRDDRFATVYMRTLEVLQELQVGNLKAMEASYSSGDDAGCYVMHLCDENDEPEVHYLCIAICASASAWLGGGVEKGCFLRCSRCSRDRHAGDRKELPFKDAACAQYDDDHEP